MSPGPAPEMNAARGASPRTQVLAPAMDSLHVSVSEGGSLGHSQRSALTVHGTRPSVWPRSADSHKCGSLLVVSPAPAPRAKLRPRSGSPTLPPGVLLVIQSRTWPPCLAVTQTTDAPRAAAGPPALASPQPLNSGTCHLGSHRLAHSGSSQTPADPGASHAGWAVRTPGPAVCLASLSGPSPQVL